MRKTLKSLKRFRKLKPKTYLKLYKTLVRPQLEYPPISLCHISKTRKSVLQAVQNTALKRAHGLVPPYLNTMEELHTRSTLEPLNVRMHRLASKTWQNLMESDQGFQNMQTMVEEEERRDHNWWPRIAPAITEESPEPIYTSH